jgi:hypothetical protein
LVKPHRGRARAKQLVRIGDGSGVQFHAVEAHATIAVPVKPLADVAPGAAGDIQDIQRPISLRAGSLREQIMEIALSVSNRSWRCLRVKKLIPPATNLPVAKALRVNSVDGLKIAVIPMRFG